jgi:hypothetical protein
MNDELSGDGVSYRIQASTSLMHELNIRDTATNIRTKKDPGEPAHYYIELPGDDSELQLWLGDKEEAREFIDAIESHLE